MPRGPNGEKRPADTIANAVHVMRVATGQIEEELPSEGQRRGGLKGGAARAEALSPEERSEIARMGQRARQEKRARELA